MVVENDADSYRDAECRKEAPEGGALLEASIYAYVRGAPIPGYRRSRLYRPCSLGEERGVAVRWPRHVVVATLAPRRVKRLGRPRLGRQAGHLEKPDVDIYKSEHRNEHACYLIQLCWRG